jgi:hypothetical protein
LPTPAREKEAHTSKEKKKKKKQRKKKQKKSFRDPWAKASTPIGT